MNHEQCAELKGSGRQQPVFEGLQVQAELLDSLSITTITQAYRNNGTRNIEAAYTFPLPLDAVLLDMTVTLGDKTLTGCVLPKQEAEEQYEEAISDGDAPVMLQNPQPGIYTMNVGNLLPGEKAVVSFRYGMFQSWQGNTLRYHLPTTIAPRYGSSVQAGLEQHQEPETTILEDNLCTFSMTIRGKAAGMMVESPSHGITIERKPDLGESLITLTSKTSFMDRDLIITVKKGVHQTATAMTTNDGDLHLLWASFQPQFDLPEDQSPRSIKIVIDCSGSMGGDSINQARQALIRIMDELRPQDWFNIIAFGTNSVPLFNAQVKATSESLAYARGFLKKLGADMGGTEIGQALEMAVRLRCPDSIQQDVLLITDGEIWEWERVAAKAEKSKHRFFTVGVGSSVSEAFVKTLANQTGGACELVSPNENMAERIHRHFKRISTPSTKIVEIQWPMKPLRVFPDPLATIYNGDTCNLFAWFDAVPTGSVRLQMTLTDGTEFVLDASIDATYEKGADLPRMAAAIQLREIGDDQTGKELAVRYQLVSRWTNYLATVPRSDEDKADTLPELHKVQQMLAAGWGGMGSTKDCKLYCSSLSVAAASLDTPKFMRSRQTSTDSFDIPTFLRERQAPYPKRRMKSCFSNDIVNELMDEYETADTGVPTWIWDNIQRAEVSLFVQHIDEYLSSGTIPTTIYLPVLPLQIAELLEDMVAEGISEQIAVILFLHCLAESAAGEAFSRQAKRVIEKAYKQLHVDQQTVQMLEKRFRLRVDA
jgi:Ca-activated chloride channel homolog